MYLDGRLVLRLLSSPYLLGHRLHHQRSRYVYELFYKRKAISRGGCEHVIFQATVEDLLSFSHTELYEYCLKEGYADKNLIAKWKKVRANIHFQLQSVSHTHHASVIATPPQTMPV